MFSINCEIPVLSTGAPLPFPAALPTHDTEFASTPMSRFFGVEAPLAIVLPANVRLPVASSVSKLTPAPDAGARWIENLSVACPIQADQDGFVASSGANTLLTSQKESPPGSWLSRVLTVDEPSRIAVFVASTGVSVLPDTAHCGADDGTAGTHCVEFPSLYEM